MPSSSYNPSSGASSIICAFTSVILNESVNVTVKKTRNNLFIVICFNIILTQGLNRQIRRMCEYLGYDVVKLKRTRIMHVNLKGLRVGQWRELSKQEMDTINRAVSNSTKTAD